MSVSLRLIRERDLIITRTDLSAGSENWRHQASIAADG